MKQTPSSRWSSTFSRPKRWQPFEVTDIDYAGPLYVKDTKDVKKAYFSLHLCSKSSTPWIDRRFDHIYACVQEIYIQEETRKCVYTLFNSQMEHLHKDPYNCYIHFNFPQTVMNLELLCPTDFWSWRMMQIQKMTLL